MTSNDIGVGFFESPLRPILNEMGMRLGLGLNWYISFPKANSMITFKTFDNQVH